MRRSTTIRLYYQSGAFALFSLYQAFISTCIHNSLEIEQPSVRPHIFKGFEIRSTFSPQSLIYAHKKNEWSFSSSEKIHLSEIHRSLGFLWGPPPLSKCLYHPAPFIFCCRAPSTMGSKIAAENNEQFNVQILVMSNVCSSAVRVAI